MKRSLTSLIAVLLLTVGMTAACGEKDGVPIATPTPPGPASLVLSLIRFSPLPPPPDSLDSPDSGWPEVGSQVTWEAVVVNQGGVEATAVPWVWIVDGVEVATGMSDFAPGGTSITLDRPWPSQREWIQFAIEGDGAGRAPDSLSIASNALTVEFRLEDPVWQWIEGRVAGGVEGWARREVAGWNSTLASYSSAGIPEGVRDRLRLDGLERVPVGAGWRAPPERDLIWYFRNGADPRFAQTGINDDQLNDQTIVLHELLHQRGVADVYAYEVVAGNTGSGMDILDPDGSRAAGTHRLPYPDPEEGYQVVFSATFDGSLMGGGYRRPTYLHDLSVWGLNENAGRRTPRFRDQFGNSLNPMTWRNTYMNRMPETIRLQVTDINGPLAGVVVDIFPDRGRFDYADYYEPHPAISLVSDSLGWVSFPGADIAPRPEPALGSVAATAIVRVIAGDRWDYKPLPLFYFSQQMAVGDSVVAEHHLRVNPR